MTSENKGFYLSLNADDCKDSGISDNGSTDDQTKPKQNKILSYQGDTLEYAKLWEELKYTSKGLDDVFEESKSSAYELKGMYDSIQQLTTINEGLQLKYYDALAEKKRFEEERDVYFKNDKTLNDRKNEFIEQSQFYALQHSKYVEYSKRFSNRREEYIKKLLKDVEKYYNRVKRLNKEKDDLRNEMSEVRHQMSDVKHNLNCQLEDNKNLMLKHEQLNERMKTCEMELKYARKQNEKLQEKNENLQEDKENLQIRTEQLLTDVKEQRNTLTSLSDTNRSLVENCAQLRQQVEAKMREISRMNEDHSDELKRRNELEDSLEDDLKNLEKDKSELVKNNHVLAEKHKELLKRFTTANMKVKKLEKVKNGIVLKEHKTREKNVELAEKQIELIDEVLLLKKGHFYDQARVKKGGKVYKNIQEKINTLKNQVEVLKQNPLAIDPENEAQDYRQSFMKKLVSMPQSCHNVGAPETASHGRVAYLGVCPQIDETLQKPFKQYVHKSSNPSLSRQLVKKQDGSSRMLQTRMSVKNRTINIAGRIAT